MKKLQTILPGMYIYVDNTISFEILKGRQIKAVVGCVEGSTILGVCLRGTELPWSSDDLKVEATREIIDGKEATQLILETAQKQKEAAEAAQWCHEYSFDGIEIGEAFLPSLSEGNKLYDNRDVINASLASLGVRLLEGWYHCATEHSNEYVKTLIMSNGPKYRDYNYKHYHCYIRPVIRIQL